MNLSSGQTQCRRTRNESYDRGSWNGSSTFRECVQHCLPLPVIGVPLSGKNLDGMDAVFSIMQMPPGVPVATVAIDGAKNAAILAAKILAASDDALLQKLKDYTTGQKEAVKAKAAKLDEVGYEAYLASK